MAEFGQNWPTEGPVSSSRRKFRTARKIRRRAASSNALSPPRPPPPAPPGLRPADDGGGGRRGPATRLTHTVAGTNSRIQPGTSRIAAMMSTTPQPLATLQPTRTIPAGVQKKRLVAAARKKVLWAVHALILLEKMGTKSVKHFEGATLCFPDPIMSDAARREAPRQSLLAPILGLGSVGIGLDRGSVAISAQDAAMPRRRALAPASLSGVGRAALADCSSPLLQRRSFWRSASSAPPHTWVSCRLLTSWSEDRTRYSSAVEMASFLLLGCRSKRGSPSFRSASQRDMCVRSFLVVAVCSAKRLSPSARHRPHCKSIVDAHGSPSTPSKGFETLPESLPRFPSACQSCPRACQDL